MTLTLLCGFAAVILAIFLAARALGLLGNRFSPDDTQLVRMALNAWKDRSDQASITEKQKPSRGEGPAFSSH
jgi:hypothetical protein